MKETRSDLGTNLTDIRKTHERQSHPFHTDSFVVVGTIPQDQPGWTHPRRTDPRAQPRKAPEKVALLRFRTRKRRGVALLSQRSGTDQTHFSCAWSFPCLCFTSPTLQLSDSGPLKSRQRSEVLVGGAQADPGAPQTTRPVHRRP